MQPDYYILDLPQRIQTMSYSKEEYISKFGKDAYFLLKSINDTGKLSYLGGYPSLPEDLEWPTIDYEGKEVQLPFLAQVNLKDLPEHISEDLPNEGFLYFFYDITFDDYNKQKPICVLYSNDFSKLPVKPNQDMLIPLDDEIIMSGLFLYQHPDILRFHPRDCFPKNEISFVKYTDINNPFHAYNDKKDNFSFGDDRQLEQNKLISKNINLKFDTFKKEHRIPFSIHSLIGRENLPEWLIGQLEYKKDKIQTNILEENWPQSWFHMEVFCIVLDKEINNSKNISIVDSDYLFLQSFISVNNEWLNKARNADSIAQVPRLDAFVFRKWVSEHYLNTLNTKSKSEVYFSIRFGLERATTSFEFSTNWLFDQTNNGQDVFTENELVIIDRYRKTSSNYPHQFLGYGEPDGNIAYPEDTYQEGTDSDSILLLQLSYDNTLMWGFGDVSTLQFRISKDALRKLKFEEATMELIM